MKRLRNGLIALVAGLAGILTEPAAADPLTVSEVIAQVRRSLGVDLLIKQPTGILLSGSGAFLGNQAPATILFDAAGRCVRRYEGPIPFAAGFNGRDAWSIEFGGMPRILAFGERAELIIFAAAITGSWLAPDAPFDFELDPGKTDEQTVTLTFRYRDGHETGTVEIDRPTWTPRKWTIVTGARSQSLLFDGMREFAGMHFPVRISLESGAGEKSVVEMQKVSAAPTFIRSPYDPPPLSTADVTFDPAAPAVLQVERAVTGHLLVRPLVNGKELGWFIFDTGAGSSVISSERREDLKSVPIAQVPAVGVGGAVLAPVFRLERVALGPMSLRDSLAIELDLRFLEAPLGRPIAGVLGFEFISRCITELDLADSRIALHDSAAYKPGDLQWSEMKLAHRVPVVDASIEGQKHPLRLDTGSNSRGVLIHQAFVERLRLLDGRATKESTAGGVGGTVPTRAGKLKWLELGSRRLENLDADFIMEARGAFNDQYTAGVVGAGILSRFTLVLDYPHQRIAFKNRSGGE